MQFHAYSIAGDAVTVTSGSSSANTALPTAGDGNTARYVLLTGTGDVHVKLGYDNTVSATANDIMVGTTPIVLNCRGYAYLAYIQESSGAKLNIAPVEA